MEKHKKYNKLIINELGYHTFFTTTKKTIDANCKKISTVQKLPTDIVNNIADWAYQNDIGANQIVKNNWLANTASPR